MHTFARTFRTAISTAKHLARKCGANFRLTALAVAAGLAASVSIPGAAISQSGQCGVEAVVVLAYGSRYGNDSVTKGVVDSTRNASVTEALKPVDDFIRDLTRHANRAAKGGTKRAASARCALTMLNAWAGADALSVLETPNAKMTIGARLAGIGMSYEQVRIYAVPEQRRIIDAWLSRRIREQITYWNNDAPPKSRRGNLKAWAALASISVGSQTGNAKMLNWGARETKKLLCNVDAHGAMPREMERGARALHYQLHALSAISSSVAILERGGVSIAGVCEDALERAVWFAVRDIESGGELSRQKTGVAQSYFTGSDKLRSHHVAFGVSFLVVSRDVKFAAWIKRFGSLNSSKLGGNQHIVWG